MCIRDSIKTAYKNIEKTASERLLDMLPQEFKEDYEPFFSKQEGDLELWKMCIRDRFMVALVVFGFGFKLFDIQIKNHDYFVKKNSTMQTYTVQIPVSYTHLDVYKRQADSFSCTHGCCTCFKGN